MKGLFPSLPRNGDQRSKDQGQDDILDPEGQLGTEEHNARDEYEHQQVDDERGQFRQQELHSLTESEDVENHREGKGKIEGNSHASPYLHSQGAGNDRIDASRPDAHVAEDGCHGECGCGVMMKEMKMIIHAPRSPTVPTTHPRRRYMITPTMVRKVGTYTPFIRPNFLISPSSSLMILHQILQVRT
jgi:hypothetical protein